MFKGMCVHVAGVNGDFKELVHDLRNNGAFTVESPADPRITHCLVDIDAHLPGSNPQTLLPDFRLDMTAKEIPQTMYVVNRYARLSPDSASGGSEREAGTRIVLDYLWVKDCIEAKRVLGENENWVGREIRGYIPQSSSTSRQTVKSPVLPTPPTIKRNPGSSTAAIIEKAVTQVSSRGRILPRDRVVTAPTTNVASISQISATTPPATILVMRPPPADRPRSFDPRLAKPKLTVGTCAKREASPIAVPIDDAPRLNLDVPSADMEAISAIWREVEHISAKRRIEHTFVVEPQVSPPPPRREPSPSLDGLESSGPTPNDRKPTKRHRSISVSRAEPPAPLARETTPLSMMVDTDVASSRSTPNATFAPSATCAAPKIFTSPIVNLPLSFYVLADPPHRRDIELLITKGHGGGVIGSLSMAQFIIFPVAPGTKLVSPYHLDLLQEIGPTRALVSHEWIQECVIREELVELAPYRLH